MYVFIGVILCISTHEQCKAECSGTKSLGSEQILRTAALNATSRATCNLRVCSTHDDVLAATSRALAASPSSHVERTGGNRADPSVNFARCVGTKAGPSIHFESSGGTGASPNVNFERSGGAGAGLGSHFEHSGGAWAGASEAERVRGQKY